MLYGMRFMKKIESLIINICKHKNIGKYVSKLEDIIITNIKLMSAINMKITRTMFDIIKNKTNIINEIIHKTNVMDNDTLHLIDDNLDEIITYLNNGLKNSKKRLETIDVYITFCCKTSGKYIY